MYALVSSGLKLRFALWALEQALPDETSLISRVTSGLWGIGFAVAGGMLAALGTAALLFLGGWMLYQDGQFTVVEAVVCVVAVAAALVTILALVARAKFRDALKSKSKAVPEGEDPLKALVNGFLEGLLAKKQNRKEEEDNKNKNTATPSYPRAA